MTTQRQVKRLVQPLLSRHDDLALVGRLIVLKPVGHLLRGIDIDRTSSADRFRPVWIVNSMFEDAIPVISYSQGNDVAWKRQPWSFATDGVADELAEQIETQALPALRSIATIADFYPWAMDVPNTPYSIERNVPMRLCLDAALGNFDAAREHLKTLRQYESSFLRNALSPDHLKVLMSAFAAKVESEDRAGVAAFLHDWECQKVKALKLEHLWQPTPFPVELGG